MLTGLQAFEGTSSVMVMGKQLHETPPPPRLRAPRRPIPRAVEAVVVRAMAKRPEARFPTASAMRAALEEVRSAPARLRDRARRAAGAVAMAGTLVVAAVASARWARVHEPALEGMRATAPAATAAVPAPSPLAALPSVALQAPMVEVTASKSTPPPASSPAPVPPLPSLREARAGAHAHPSSPRALEAWARASLRAGELREAHRAAAAWALHDGTVEPRLVMAEVMGASGRQAEGVALLTEWLESHPDAADARAALSRLSGDAIARR